MSKQERVVCAAFRFVFSCCEEIVLTLDYKMNYHAQDLYGREYLTGFEKGFITNKNRFVDPIEAMSIAVKYGQVGRIFEKRVEMGMLREWGLLNEVKIKQRELSETMSNYLEFPLKPEDLY